MSDALDEAAVRTEVAGKSSRLRAFFPPEAIVWESPPHEIRNLKGGEAILCIPVVQPHAIWYRLDEVLGIDGWSEEYASGPDWEECTLRVKMHATRDWVQRVSRTTKGADWQKATTQALREAAHKLGIGTYLATYVTNVEWDGKQYKTLPELPQEALPDHCKHAGREMAQKIRQLAAQCCEETKRENLGNANFPETIARIASRYGLKPDSKSEYGLWQLQQRQASESLRMLGDWLANIAIEGRKKNPGNKPVPQTAEKTAEVGNEAK